MTWVFYNFYSGIWIRIGEILKYYGGVICLRVFGEVGCLIKDKSEFDGFGL